MARRSPEPQPSTRDRAHAALIRDALERPGIREVMRVYEGWQHADSGLDHYRAATHEPQYIITTDHTGQR